MVFFVATRRRGRDVLDALIPSFSERWAPIGWPFYVPFVLHALRALTPLLLLGIPRNHPRREVLCGLCVLFALATDLLDGTVARRLKMVQLKALGAGDLVGDVTVVLGAFAVIGLGLSLARDLDDARLARERRRPRLELGLMLLGSLVLAEIVWLTMARTFR